MTMQNPYEDLIKTIDIILREIELSDKKTVSLLTTNLPARGPEHPAGRIKFFERLKEHGAIKDFSVMNMAGMPYGLILNQPNKDKLLEERQRLVNFDQPQSRKRSSARTLENKGSIKKLELVKPKAGNKFKIIINEDYLNPIYGDRAMPSWDLLFRVAEEELMDAENHKNAIDYFNSNKKCRLYTKTGHDCTKILKVEGGYISPAVEIKIITEKAFQQRANKS